jgi:MSHA biogenesis protein MshL
VSPGTTLAPLPASGAAPGILSSAGEAAINAVSGLALGAGTNAAGSLFGLAFQTSNFAALISFLESQGTVHVLSSPRIATLNNQKAVLKVGTDEFFVTNVSTTTTTGTASTTTPSVTLQSFFSGVVLDVTPQIDERGNVILHIHPSVSQVSTVNKNINLGVGGALTLPLASSSTSETDSIVRGKDGHIVAIGGLMRQSTVSDRSQLPGAGDVPGVGGLFRNTSQVTQKRELVILLKPTVVQDDNNWADNMLESQQRIQGLDPRRSSERR